MCVAATPKPVLPTEQAPTPQQQEQAPSQTSEQERLRQRQRAGAAGNDTVLSGATSTPASTTKSVLGA